MRTGAIVCVVRDAWVQLGDNKTRLALVLIANNKARHWKAGIHYALSIGQRSNQ